MKKPKMPKNKTLASIAKYDQALDDYNKLQTKIAAVKKKASK